VDPSEHGVAVRPLPNSALVSACVESSVTTASAHGPERAPIGRTKHSSRCGRSIVHPVARRGSAPVYPLGTREPLRGQLRIALNNGVTKDEIVDLFIHLEAYAGAARAFDSYQIALEIFAETTGTE